MKYSLMGLLVGALLLGGCKDQAPEPPNVNGSWQGTTSSGLTMRYTLSQNETAVTGTALITSPAEQVSATVTGTYVTPTLSLNVSAQGFEDFNFTGTHGDNHIIGTLNGSGFQGRPLTLAKLTP